MPPTDAPTTALSRLFRVTIRRAYTAEYRAKWPASTDYATTTPWWGDTADAARADAEAAIARNRDTNLVSSVTAVEAVPDDELADLRIACAVHYARDIAPVRAAGVLGDRYAPCCDLAILRSCVCVVSYTCPVHGRHCHGSHD